MADDVKPKARGKPLARGPRLDDASTVEQADVEEAERFWRSAAPEDMAGLLKATPDAQNGPRDAALAVAVWLWLTRSRLFRKNTPGARAVARTKVRAAVDAVVTAAEQKAEALAARLKAGAADLAAWQAGMEQTVRSASVAAAAVGAGGLAVYGSPERRRTKGMLAAQFGYLADFADELHAGLALDGDFARRAVMYASSATAAYEAVLRAADLAAGWNWERRLIHSGKSCSQCLDYAGRGWVPAGTLPGLGEDCDCKSNCKCSFERVRSRTYPGDLSMAADAELIDREKCRKRARLAARTGVEAAPVRLSGPQALAVAPAGSRLATATGSLPATDHEALDRVNAVLAHQGLDPLRAEQVLVHYLEAGSTHFIPSRSMFLAESTLRNIAREATAGFAFLNSHRAGGLSSPAELPYGRTFAGRFEQYRAEDGSKWSRTMLGVYMLAGVKPNGDQGPSTDDFSAAINAGTIFDVSLGVSGFTLVCDVCNNRLDARDKKGNPLCPHIPGTSHRMEASERKAQKKRGVPGGVATYSLVDGHASEVSAVYNGAVPGAGFTRALSAARSGRLSRLELAEARASYAPLIGTGAGRRPGRSVSLFDNPKGSAMTLKELKALLGLSGTGQDDEDVDVQDDREFSDPPAPNPRKTPAPAPAANPDAATLALREQLAETTKQLAAANDRAEKQEQARLKAERDAVVASFGAKASELVSGHKAADVLTAAQAEGLSVLYAALAEDDHDRPIPDVSRVGMLSAVMGECKPHGKTEEKVGHGKPPESKTRTLSNGGDGGYDPVAAARAQNESVLGPPPTPSAPA